MNRCLAVALHGALASSTLGATQLASSFESVWEIDPLTAASTIIAENFEPSTLPGLAYNTTDGFLYGGGNNNLHRINPQTGALTTLTLTGDFFFDGLAYSTADANLYAVGGETLWRIDPTTQASTVISSTLDTPALTALAFNSSDGLLYVGGANNLYSIEPGTGSIALINAAVGFTIEGLAYNPDDGYLYAGNNNNLLRLDPIDGSASVVTLTGDFWVKGFATIPSPSTAFFGIVCPFVVSRRRRVGSTSSRRSSVFDVVVESVVGKPVVLQECVTDNGDDADLSGRSPRVVDAFAIFGAVLLTRAPGDPIEPYRVSFQGPLDPQSTG